MAFLVFAKSAFPLSNLEERLTKDGDKANSDRELVHPKPSEWKLAKKQGGPAYVNQSMKSRLQELASLSPL